MSVRSAQSVTAMFTTRNLSGSGVNADSLPTGTLYQNGTANGATVTVTNVSTGLYKVAVTLPTLAIGDELYIVIAATVNSISDSGVAWNDTCDLTISSAGIVGADLQTIKTQTVTASAGVTFSTTVGTSTLTQTQVSGYMGPILTDNSTGLVTANTTKIGGTTQTTGDIYGYLGTNLGALGANATALAPSSTALSTATWTSTVAGRIDAAVSSRMATYTQPMGFLAATFPSGTIANTTNITAGTITTVANQLTAAQVATGVWQDTTAGDFTTAGSIGRGLFTSGNAPGAASGLAIVGSNVTFATGTDFSPTMKTSLNAATPTVSLGTNAPAGWINKAAYASDIIDANGWQNVNVQDVAGSVAANLTNSQMQQLVANGTNTAPNNGAAPTGSAIALLNQIIADGGGGGANAQIVNVKDQYNANVQFVQITAIANGMAQAIGNTNANGNVTLSLDTGIYTIIPILSGFIPPSPTFYSVPTTVNIVMTRQAVAPSPPPGACNVSFTAYNQDLTPATGVVFSFKIVLAPSGFGSVYRSASPLSTVTSDDDGDVLIVLPQNSQWVMTDPNGIPINVDVGAVTELVLDNVIV